GWLSDPRAPRPQRWELYPSQLNARALQEGDPEPRCSSSTILKEFTGGLRGKDAGACRSLPGNRDRAGGDRLFVARAVPELKHRCRQSHYLCADLAGRAVFGSVSGPPFSTGLAARSGLRGGWAARAKSDSELVCNGSAERSSRA